MLPSISSVPEPLFWTVRVVGAVTITGPVPRLRNEPGSEVSSIAVPRLRNVA